MRDLKVRTSRGMVQLSGVEARVLRDRLRASVSGRPAAGTITVSANASTSVTFTDAEKAAVLDVLDQWTRETPADGVGDGLSSLRSALEFDGVSSRQQ